MLLSKSAEYGVRATLYLASLESKGFVSIRDISDELDISFHFLTKIFQRLTRDGILQSFRGPNGGVALARPASAITLRDIVVAIDGGDLFRSCLLGLPGCGEGNPCPLHDQWAVERARLEEMLANKRLDETAYEVTQNGLRLSLLPTDR